MYHWYSALVAVALVYAGWALHTWVYPYSYKTKPRGKK